MFTNAIVFVVGLYVLCFFFGWIIDHCSFDFNFNFIALLPLLFGFPASGDFTPKNLRIGHADSAGILA
jgi:hypothetical protein